ARAFEAYERAAAVIRGGISAVVFPEGTRSRTGELLPFKNAPFGLAIAAGVPVVPVYVHNSFQILPKGGVRLHPRPIRVLIGEPIATAGLSLDHRQLLAERTRAALLALRARVDSGAASREGRGHHEYHHSPARPRDPRRAGTPHTPGRC